MVVKKKVLDVEIVKDYEIENSSSINYTNTKGYYEFITKLLIGISKSRIMKDYETWVDCVDAFYTATFPWWKNQDEVDKYEALYKDLLFFMNTQEKSFSDNITANMTFKIKRTLRDMTKIIMSNTKHIMLKDDADTDEYDEEKWFDD